ncbi:MAG TPA: ECF transporter S component [Anaerovoracaceae bacterium]|nr:ECF transporter S component [Anaerovoracaceae bacterium]
MNTFQLNEVSFSYPKQEKPALKNLNLEIRRGEFVTLCGPSGCGKTTLLRQLKTSLAPHGDLQGEILFEGTPLSEIDQRTQASKIGFVLQSPENQIVTDKVWHELAFGLESLGFDTPAIRLRVAEMASFFGIQNWFYKKVTELSGGQKQLLNLASVMVMQPSVLILDEPTSQLDPIAASDFLAAVSKINRELGVTVLLTEHRLEEAFPMSDRVLVLDKGLLICDGTPKEVGISLSKRGHGMFRGMPAPMRIFAGVPNTLECPVTVREGRSWLDRVAEESGLRPHEPAVHESGGAGKRNTEGKGAGAGNAGEAPVIELKEVWFKYEKNGPDVIKGLNLTVRRGEFAVLLGGNGTGKTTALSLVSGINAPYRGQVKVTGSWAALPQNPQSLFVKKTVEADLLEMLKERKLSKEEKEKKLRKVVKLCRLQELLGMHPYDLSCGEQQRAALSKVLLLEPEILLLDEPTKGLDSEFKLVFASILRSLQKRGVTVLMVSHDVEFCAEHAQRCAMFFDGSVVTEDVPYRFFSGNSFYTTAANRMARHLFPEAVTADDVTLACGGVLAGDREPDGNWDLPDDGDSLTGGDEDFSANALSAGSGRPRKSAGIRVEQTEVKDRKLSKRTRTAAFMILAAIPFTIFIGIYYFGDRRYYFISMLILLEILLPFAMVFESRKPQARELIVIAVLCGIAVAGRAAFFWAPQFKPVTAIVMISAVAFGGEAGFLVGAMTALVSNMFFGQGPWTPWQMFAFGTIGFLTGILFKKGLLRSNKYALAIFGGLTAFFIYGGIMNPAAVLMFQGRPTKEMFYLTYLQGIPFDLIHAAATVFFLLLAAEPMLEKLERIKIKYGLAVKKNP